MSTNTRWTPAQLRGVTNTVEPPTTGDDDAGAWTEDLDIAIYGEQEWTLPGMEKEGPECGSWRPMSFCDSLDHPEGESRVQLGQHNCGRRGCPRCWNRWARERTVNGVARLGALRHISHPRAVHALLSPPEGSVTTIDGFYRARSRAVSLAKEHGIRGGLLVTHGYRVKDDIKDLFRMKLELGKWDPSEDGGIWRFIRENDRDWRDQVYWSPHFHVVGLSADVKPSDPEGDDGWILKNIKRGDSHSLARFTLTDDEGYEDMARVIRYLLSHATYEASSSRQVVTWFGEAHGTVFCPDPEAAKERKTEPSIGPLSDGAWSAIQRKAEELVGGETNFKDGEGGGEEVEECPCDECDGELRPMNVAYTFLDQQGERLDNVDYRELYMAWQWWIGDVEPPPGMKHPRTQAQGREVLELLCE